MIEAYDWLIAFQGSEGSDQSYCNNELSPFSRGQQMQRGEEHMQKARILVPRAIFTRSLVEN
jgi:hypothetical protein